MRKVLESERLTLHRLTRQDTDFVIELLNDEGFLRYIGDRGVRNRADAIAYLQAGPLDNYRRHGYGLYLLRRKSDAAKIGICGLVRREALPEPDLGMALLPAYRNRGYAREAAAAVLGGEPGRHGIRRVLAVADPANEASIRLLEGAGFAFERRMRLSPDAEEVNLYARDTGVVAQAQAGDGMTKWMANKGARTGVFFGATSGVITTIGLIVGLYAGTRSLVAVLGGILVIAVADAMSDALGIHLAQESDPESTHEHIWSATAWTFLSKLIVAASFALPLIWLPLGSAVLVSVIWGLLVITALSVYLARAQQNAVLPVVAEHVLIAIAVVGISHLIGRWVSTVAT